MARSDSLTGIDKERYEKYKQSATIQLEERLKLDVKIKRRHSAVISDIPKEANADLDGLNPNDIRFKNKIKTSQCSCCYEMVTKIVSYDYHGARLIERYCDINVKTFGP
jgi:hypothetical protein